MLPYFLLLFLSGIIPLAFYDKGRYGRRYAYNAIAQKRNRMTTFLFFVLLFLLLSCRDISVGTDLSTYKSIFVHCTHTSFEGLSKLQWELGYTYYNKCISFISKEYRFFLIITAFIILRPIYQLYAQEKKYSFLLIVLFVNMPCFLMIFSGLRQAIATSIGVLVYMAIDRKKNLQGFLLILLAITFHSSAFVLFLLYPAFRFRIKSKHLPLMLPAVLAVYVFRVPIFTTLIALLPSKYIEFYGEVQQTGAFGMMILFLLFSAFSFVILDEDAMSAKDHFMRNVLLIATVFQLFVPIHGLIQRASYYFLIFIPVSIVSVVQAPKRRWKNVSNLAVVVLTAFFFLYFFYTAYFSTDNVLDVFPYKFFWE